MKVLYVLKRYPRLSETFVVREVLGVERCGIPVLIDALGVPEDEPRHPAVADVRAVVRYLPRRPRLLRDHVLTVLVGVLVRRPGEALRFTRTTAASSWSAHRRAGAREARAAWRTWRLALLVAGRVRREGVTHVHCHFATAAAEVAVPAGRLAGVPVTVTAHAKDIYQHDNAEQLARRLRGAATVVTVSDHNRRHLQEVLGGTPVVHVPNGVALGSIVSGTVADPQAPVLCVARLVDKKGVDTLLRAAALAADEDPHLRLEVVGTGPLREPLTELAARLGLAERVRWRGAQPADEVERAYARACAVALPCRISHDGDRDGLPTVLVEALARGLPVVSTDVVGVGELVRDGETGLLVPPDDPEALAAALLRLRRDPQLAGALGRCGRALVRSAYDPDDAAHRLRRTWAAAAA